MDQADLGCIESRSGQVERLNHFFFHFCLRRRWWGVGGDFYGANDPLIRSDKYRKGKHAEQSKRDQSGKQKALSPQVGQWFGLNPRNPLDFLGVFHGVSGLSLTA